MKRHLIIAAMMTAVAYSSAIAQSSTGMFSIIQTNSQPTSPTEIDAKMFENIDTSVYECIYNYEMSSFKLNEKNTNSPFSSQKANENAEKAIDQTYTILQIGNNLSKFYDYTQYRADSATIAQADRNVINDYIKATNLNPSYFTTCVFQNHPEGSMTIDDEALQQTLSYNQPLDDTEWNLTADTLTIEGYLCYKATASFGGRNWEVWYTEEIPVIYGPWKFFGLPGLTIRANDSEHIHNFSLTTFRKSSSPIVRIKNSKRIASERKKIIELKCSNAKLDPSQISDITITKDKSIIINGQIWRKRNNQQIPLELK